jgi:hypothetical protein
MDWGEISKKGCCFRCKPYHISNSRPFRPLKGKPKPNTNTLTVVEAAFGCFVLVSPLGDGRGETGANKSEFLC